MPEVSLALLCGLLFGLVAHHLALALRSVIIIIISTSVFLPQCVLAAVCSWLTSISLLLFVCLLTDTRLAPVCLPVVVVD